MRRLFLTLLLFLVILPVSANSEDFKIISAEELKKMIDRGERILIIDARTRSEYWQGHIPKSINIEPEKIAFIESFLPKDKNRLLVFYCRGWS